MIWASAHSRPLLEDSPWIADPLFPRQVPARRLPAQPPSRLSQKVSPPPPILRPIHHSTKINGLSSIRRANNYVTPEQFGTPGVGADDNALFTAALATGKPIFASGPLYRLNPMTLNDLNNPPTIVFSRDTVVRNLQEHGVKVAAITVTGSKSTNTYEIVSFEKYHKGGAGPVYGPTLTDLYANGVLPLSLTLNLSSTPTDIAAGDTVEVYEDNGLTTETLYGTRTATDSDMNYRQFMTVDSVTSTQVYLQEFFAYHFTPTGAGKSLKIRKVNFMENAHVLGGIYTGQGSCGGGVAFKLCRKGVVGDCKGMGDAIDNPMWSAPVFMEECWETERRPTYAENCLFAGSSIKNQECRFGSTGGKSTRNGGYVTWGDHMCTYEEIVLTSPGIFSGDGMSIGSGFRRNIVNSLTMSAGNCYGVWLRQGSDDNVFKAIQSYNMITTVVQDFGNRNTWNIKSRGHPSNGILITGEDTTANVDIECSGLAVIIRSETVRPRVFGRAVSTSNEYNSYDLQLGSNIVDPIVDLTGGPRGLQVIANYVGPIYADIHLRGPKAFSHKTFDDSVGSTGHSTLTGVTGVSQPLTIPGYATDGTPAMVPLTAEAGYINRVYEIELSSSVGLDPTSNPVQTNTSIYRAYTNLNHWYLRDAARGEPSLCTPLDHKRKYTKPRFVFR